MTMQSADPTTSSPSSSTLFVYYGIRLPLVPRTSVRAWLRLHYHLTLAPTTFRSRTRSFISGGFVRARSAHVKISGICCIYRLSSRGSSPRPLYSFSPFQYRLVFVSEIVDITPLLAARRAARIHAENAANPAMDAYIGHAIGGQRRQLGRFREKLRMAGVNTFADVVVYSETDFYSKFTAQPITRERFNAVLDRLGLKFPPVTMP